MKQQRRVLLVACATLAAALPLRASWAGDAEEARDVVDKARIAFGEVVNTKDLDSLRAGLKTAKAVLIYPNVLKAGFFLGGSGGTGVLLVRGANNSWSEPAFYTMGSVSFGLQFGGQSADVVLLINTQKGIDKLMTTSVKLGGDVSVAAGPVGAGQAANVTADLVSYSTTKGVFAGISLEGSVVGVRESLNHAYYGKSVTPIDIVVKRAASNNHSSALRSTVAAAAK